MFRKLFIDKSRILNYSAMLFFIVLALSGLSTECISQPMEQVKQSKPVKKQNLSRTYKLINQSYATGSTQMKGYAGYKMQRPVSVRLERNGYPVPREKILFSIINTPATLNCKSSLTKKVVLTDKTGSASTFLQINDGEGIYIVSASSENEVDRVEPVFIRIEAVSRYWHVTMIVFLIGGLAFFLLGMNLTGQSLQKLAGDRMRTILNRLTSNKWRGAGLGIIITFILQSSSASTVMLVGLVSATLLTLGQAIGVIIGAKIATTLTVQIIAFNISSYAPAFIALGLLISTVTSKKKVVRIGRVITGFGFIFFGMGFMSDAMSPLRSQPGFAEMLIILGDNPLYAILFSILLTAVIQSSSATIGLSLVLASQNLLNLEACLLISIGSSVGTCATALIASVNTSRPGKQVALSHLIFSTMAMLVFMLFLDPFVYMTKEISTWLGHSGIVRQVANGFTLYSVAAAIIFLPLTALIEKITVLMLPIRKEDLPFSTRYIQESSIEFPAIAIEEAARETIRMSELVLDILKNIKCLIEDPSERQCYELAMEDDKIDTLERAIRPFLAETGRQEMNKVLTARLRTVVYISDTLENIGDIITHSLLHALEKMGSREVKFSEEGKKELLEYLGRILFRFKKTTTATIKPDHEMAKEILDEAEAEDWKARDMRESHLRRLHEGTSVTVESSEGHLTVIDSFLSINRRITDIARIVYDELPKKPKW